MKYKLICSSTLKIVQGPNLYISSNKNSLVSGSNNKNKGKINSYTFIANNLKQMCKNKSEMSKHLISAFQNQTQQDNLQLYVLT